MAVKRFMMPTDYTGELASNRVVGEIHELTNTQFKLVVPLSGFFYTHNLKVYDETMKLLEAGTHYQTIYANEEVQMRTPGLEVCGAIILKPTTTTRTVSLSYNQVGGPYANYTAAIEAALLALDLDGREIDFANLKGLPEYFTAGPHAEDIGNVFGFEYVKQGIDRLRETLDRSGKTTAEQVSSLLNDLIDSINLMYQEHTSDAKAHGTTASDVGAYSKLESDAAALQFRSEIEGIREELLTITNSQGSTGQDLLVVQSKLRLLSRRVTVVSNVAMNAIRRLGGTVNVSGGGGGGGDTQGILDEVNRLLGNYVLKTAVAYGAITHAALLGKIPVINQDGGMHVASSMDWHMPGSDADYDAREIVQYNDDLGGNEIFNTAYYNAIDFHQRSDERDKEVVGELTVERARAIIRFMGPAVLFNFIGSSKVTAGVIAQRLQQVYPEAVVETKINDEGETRLVIKAGAINALLMTAVYDIYTR